ncbi:MAG: sialate O-acetylesterase [Fermentimonas sp.]|jgi:hypothetical protein
MTSKIYILMISILVLVGYGTKQDDNRTEFFPKIEQKPNVIPDKENIWVFILAGQSNMAGRGKIEPIDTIPDFRIFTINKEGELILAKEPLHFYEPTMTGLDCGLSFGKELLKQVPDSISLLIMPTAVGGSSISQWINDSTFRNVTLMTNFKEKIEIAQKYGTIKGILWHQGESDATTQETIDIYNKQLRKLFTLFRNAIGNSELPIVIGELGSFSKADDKWKAINSKIEEYIKTDPNSFLIKTNDLKDKGDKVHFDSEGQREIGRRFAERFIKIQK